MRGRGGPSASRRALAFAAFLAVVTACSGGSAPAVPAVEDISAPMPALAGQVLTGGTLVRNDYVGRVTVVNFWATTCAPCVREMPLLSSLHDRPDGAFVVGVNYREGAAIAREFARDLDVAYPSVRDADGSLAHRFDVPFLPTTFVVDRNGQMRFKVVGELNAETLERLVDEVRTT
jgi:thiol-disulfide isomerase/thioredoxin